MPPEPDVEESLPGAAERRLADGRLDRLIREEPLQIEAAGESVLTMRTPGADEDLAVGFLLSEGVIETAAAITSLRLRSGDPGALQADTVLVDVAAGRARVAGRLTRTHEIRPSCGICGLTDPDAILEELPPLLPGVPRLTRARVAELRREFERLQPHFRATGACHGAALFDGTGSVLGHGEDVGRHNALDKAIGMAARAGAELERAIAVLSGRAGYDLVVKCLRLRIPAVLSVSAPSALSFDLCEAAGATLIGYLRPDRMQVYTDPGRLAD